MTCPKCGGQSETVKLNEVEIDRCTQCKGIWFDFRENEQLQDRAGQIDTGKPTGQGSSPSKIDCPRCRTRMITMAVLDQPHIKYECCSICFGVFFDAGEYRDAATKSFGDFIQRLKM